MHPFPSPPIYVCRPAPRSPRSTRIPRFTGHAHDINEPGGRLFGERIRAPGESRVWFDWEYAQYASMATAVVLLVVGLGSRPGKSYKQEAEEEAARRLAAGQYD